MQHIKMCDNFFSLNFDICCVQNVTAVALLVILSLSYCISLVVSTKEIPQRYRSTIAMNLDRVEAVQAVTDEGRRFRLLTSSQLFGKNGLDEEEGPCKADVSFLDTKKQKRHQGDQKSEERKPDRAQGDWRDLEASLTVHTSSPTRQPSVALSPSKSNWHEIPEIRMTPEIERDLRIVENRKHLDPKRFYKSSGTGRKKGQLPTRVHMGTVVVGAHDFYSGRLTKKERRKSILEEVMSDERIMKFTKNKSRTLQQAKNVRKRIIDPAARKRGRSRK